MAEKEYRVTKRIQEGDKVYMPGDVYDGPQLKKLGPNHPWIKAGWFDVWPAPKAEDEAPEKEPERGAEKDTKPKSEDTGKPPPPADIKPEEKTGGKNPGKK